MLDTLIPDLKEIGPKLDELEIERDFPVWAKLCSVGEQTTNILQYSGGIENFLGKGSVINSRKCNTVMFKTDYGDFGGGYNYIMSEDKKKHCELYNDCPYFLALDYDGVIIAFVGFHTNDDGDTEVVQVQGSKLFGKNHLDPIKHNGYLKDFKWKEYLITELIEYLRKYHFGRKLVIQSAKNNCWLEISSYVNRQPGTRGYNTYDQVALDMGFEGDPVNNYAKDIL